MRKLKLLIALCMVAIAASASINTDGGKHYLKNVATGKYWGAGNDWGTRASLVNHPEYVTLVRQSDGQYTIDSQVSNGGSNHYFSGDYMDGGNAYWLTFTQKEGNQYTIAAGTNYYGWDGLSTVLGKNLDAASENVVWEVYTEEEMRTLLEAATESAPVDATWLILNPNFGRNNRWGGSLSTKNDQVKNADLGSAWTFEAGNKDVNGNATNYCVESWHSNFTLSQTLTNVPNGEYELTAQGFYRQDGSDNEHLPVFYINDKTATFQPMGTLTDHSGDGKNGMDDASVEFTNGNYKVGPIHVTVGDGTITLGAKLEGNTALWCIWDNFELTYFGVDLSAYKVQITTLRSTLNTVLNSTEKYNASVKEAAQTTYSETESVDETQAAMEEAISKLNTAIESINTSIANYDALEVYLAKGQTLDAAGQAALAGNATVQPLAAAYQTLTFEALTAEQITVLDAALIAAAKAQTTAGSDWTLALLNPSFEKDLDGSWTAHNMGRQGNKAFNQLDGDYYIESWQPKSDDSPSVKQTITLPAGVYSISAKVMARGLASAKLVAAGLETAITIADAINTYEVQFACEDNAEVTFGLEGVGTGAGNSWLAADDFHMTLVSTSLPDLTPVEGKMNAEVAATQTAAIETYNASRTLDNYNAAEIAIAAAQASVNAYLPMGEAITKIDAALTAATSATASDADYQAIKTAYNNGTIADADIEGKVKEAYNVVIPVIKSQTAASADFTLAIQNPSFEYGDLTGWTVEASSDTGARETSNATYAATGADGKYLFNIWWRGNPLTQTVAGLPNGQYTMTASVASDGATVYLIANGTHNEGTETGGSYPGKDVMQEATITFVVTDGNATIGVVGGDDGTAGEHKAYREDGYWWYKADNFRLVKNRDLSPVYAVIGSKKGDDTDKVIFSGAWDAATQTDILEENDGVYTKTYANVELDAQTIAFKAIKKADVEATTVSAWYPEGTNNNSEIVIPVKGIYNITISFDGTNPATGVATKTAEAVTISDKLWATTVTNSALNFKGSEVKAYTAKVESNEVKLTKVDDVQAETGLVLKGATAGTYYIPVIESSTTDKGSLMFSSTLTYNMYQPNNGTVNTYYGLTVNSNNEAQFTKISTDNGVTLPAGKAFLEINTPAEGARELKVVFAGETTGIDAVVAEKSAEGVYNLNGQRVAAPAKGLYIVNGKKVILK